MSEIHPKINRTDAGTKRLATTLSPAASTTSSAPAVSVKPHAKRWATRRAVLLGVLAIVMFVYVGGQRRAIGPSAGVLDVRAIVSAVPADQPAKLRIGTYNIHMGKGTDGRTDLSRIAGVIGGLDFVGLNEVLGAAPWEKEDQAATLGNELKMTSLYTPTEERWWTAKFGNGFLSKLDVQSWQVVPLERRHGKSFRNLVHIRAKAANGTPLNLVVTHIDRSDDRERHEQLKTVGEYFLSLQKPAILLGDMNSDAHDPAMIKLLEGTDIVDALGKAKGFNAPRHIDWILTRGLEVKDAGMSPVGPSDHAHVWAELTVPAANTKVAEMPTPYWLNDGDVGYFAPGTEFKLSREIEAQKTSSPTDKHEAEPKPVDSSKLREAAAYRNGIDLIDAVVRTPKPLFEKPYVSILPLPTYFSSTGTWLLPPDPRDRPIELKVGDERFTRFEHPEIKPPPPPPRIDGPHYVGFGR